MAVVKRALTQSSLTCQSLGSDFSDHVCEHRGSVLAETGKVIMPKRTVSASGQTMIPSTPRVARRARRGSPRGLDLVARTAIVTRQCNHFNTPILSLRRFSEDYESQHAAVCSA